MSGIGAFAAIFCAALSALNVAIYADTGSAANLGAAIFCGLLVLVNLAVGARR